MAVITTQQPQIIPQISYYYLQSHPQKKTPQCGVITLVLVLIIII